MLAQVVSGFADFALAGQKDQNIATVLRVAPQLIHRIGYIELAKEIVACIHFVVLPATVRQRNQPLIASTALDTALPTSLSTPPARKA